VTSFARMTGAQLDAHFSENNIPVPDGWSKMKVAEKRAWVKAWTAPVEAPLEAAPEGTRKIKLISAMSNPVPLYVHGAGFWSLVVGETYTLPIEALDALRGSDAVFEEV